MKILKLIAWTLALTGMASCSETESVPDPEAGGTEVTLMPQSATGPQATVYVFRQRNGGFLLDRVVNEGWTPEGSLTTRLPQGDYKFLFAAFPGVNMRTDPDPAAGVPLEGLSFVLKEDPAAPGYCLPADELFLPADPQTAETVYPVREQGTVVQSTLTRAVGRLVIRLKRGYAENGTYLPTPFTAPDNITGYVEKIAVEITGAGRSVNPRGTAGTAATLWTVDATAPDGLSEEGFARYDGPFLLPPASGRTVRLKLTVTPPRNSGLPPITKETDGLLERNKQLEITLWLNFFLVTVDVTADLSPMTEEEPGDEGMWE